MPLLPSPSRRKSCFPSQKRNWKGLATETSWSAGSARHTARAARSGSQNGRRQIFRSLPKCPSFTWPTRPKILFSSKKNYPGLWTVSSETRQQLISAFFAFPNVFCLIFVRFGKARGTLGGLLPALTFTKYHVQPLKSSFMKFYGKKTLAAALIGGAFSFSLWGSLANAQQLPLPHRQVHRPFQHFGLVSIRQWLDKFIRIG